MISSASRRLVKRGPGLSLNSPACWSYMYVPITSAGRRSGVNWTLLNLHPRADENVFAISVFASPGKSSISMLPFERIPIVTLLRFSCFPIMTLLTSFIRPLDIWETVCMSSLDFASPALDIDILHSPTTFRPSHSLLECSVLLGPTDFIASSVPRSGRPCGVLLGAPPEPQSQLR